MRVGQVTCRWVKAHLSLPDALAAGFSEEDWQGNSVADELAGQAARAQLPPPEAIERRGNYLALLEATQRLQAAVQSAVLQHDHGGGAPGAARIRRR